LLPRAVAFQPEMGEAKAINAEEAQSAHAPAVQHAVASTIEHTGDVEFALALKGTVTGIKLSGSDADLKRASHKAVFWQRDGVVMKIWCAGMGQ